MDSDESLAFLFDWNCDQMELLQWKVQFVGRRLLSCMWGAAPHPIVRGEEVVESIRNEVGEGIDRMEALLQLEIAEAREMAASGVSEDSEELGRLSEDDDGDSPQHGQC